MNTYNKIKLESYTLINVRDRIKKQIKNDKKLNEIKC
jgi:hypothetical protein